jgi:hypothetical protein
MIATTTLLYSSTMFFCWIPLLLCAIIGTFDRDLIFNSDFYEFFFQFSINISTQNGTVIAIIFYLYSPQVIEKYKQFLCKPSNSIENTICILDEDEVDAIEEDVVIEKEIENVILETIRDSDIEIGNVVKN